MYLAVYLLLTIGYGWFNLQRLAEVPESWLVKGLLTGGFAGALGVLLGAPDLFGIIWLWAWGLFGVCTGWAALAAIVLRREQRGPAIVLAACAAGLAAFSVQAFLVEPTALELNRHEVVSEKVTAPVRIALIADLQTDDPGEYELGALKRAMAEKPDMILFAGDYVQALTLAEYTQRGCQRRSLI